ncbi:MAG: methyltransferase domain-containing protein [Chloroflexota bacterium]|nr:methyltransferase domain-containing protein [Chloroflexota bacterium]
MTERYAFDNATPRERERLAALEAVFDPLVVRHLEGVGVGERWRCLDVGAGGGSIAAWLCRRVGPGGRVVATDLDTRFLAELALPTLDVRRHDIRRDPLEEQAFDLAHARLLLEHLADSEHALARMIAALKPGGWLVVADLDWVSAVPDLATDPADAELFSRVQRLGLGLMETGGFNPAYGRQLPRLLRTCGLVDVRAEGHTWVAQGGSPGATWWRLTFGRLCERLLASGALTEQEVTRVLALVTDPDFAFLYPTLLVASGRRAA